MFSKYCDVWKIIIEKEIRANIVTTKKGSKPIIVSPGHKVGMKSCVEILKHCMKENHKLPEPLHLAHRYANKIRRQNSEEKSE